LNDRPGLALYSTGSEPPALEEDPQHQERLARATITLRARQSARLLPGLLIASVIVFLVLRHETVPWRLGAWISLVVAFSALRAWVCGKILRRIDKASVADLAIFESALFVTVVGNGLAYGSVFWWVGLVGTERAVLSITLLSCLYSIGALVNASVHFPSFATGVLLNLGQAMLFSAGLGQPAREEVAVVIGLTIVLLISFGRQNARQFEESIRIRAHNVALNKRLSDEKAAVVAALETARKANEDKNRFIAAASHDLRQPLHALNLFLTSLSLLVAGDEAKRIVRKVMDTADDLAEQFNSILDLSRFDAGVINIERTVFRIDDMLTELVEQIRPDAEDKGLDLQMSVRPVLVRSDRLLLGRVSRNLLANAVRYTTTGVVKVAMRQEGGRVIVEVSDTGPGISHENLERIFDEFFQLTNPARQRDRGVGLGLAIVKRISNLLDMRVAVESTEGVGTRFTLSLPPAGIGDDPGPLVISPAAGDKAMPAPGLCVWVVEDDPKVSEALEFLLEQWGCCPVVVKSRTEIKDRFLGLNQWPDFFIIDDMLGEADNGLSIAQWLQGEVGRDRIILVTGNTVPERLRELNASGFRVILKPARPDLLIEILSAVTTQHRGPCADDRASV